MLAMTTTKESSARSYRADPSSQTSVASDTPGARMEQRRTELGLRQSDVAEQIKYIRKDGHVGKMSRSAYCMHESNQTALNVETAKLIAEVLGVSPSWLAFGDPQDVIDQVDLNETGEFVEVDRWSVNVDWLFQRFDVDPAQIAFVRVPQATKYLAQDDIAIVHKGVTPGATGADFVFDESGRLRIANVSRPSLRAPFEVRNKEGKRLRDLPDDVTFLGKVIGKIGE